MNGNDSMSYNWNYIYTDDEPRCQWYGDTYKTNPLWQHVEHSICPIWTYMDMVACDLYMCQSKAFRESEVRPTPMLISQVSRTCLVPSQPRTSSFDEKLIQTPSFCLKAVLYATFVISLFILPEAHPCSLYLWGSSMLIMYTRRTPVYHDLPGGPTSFMFHKVDPYPLCSWRTFISHDLGGRSLYECVGSLIVKLLFEC